MDLITGQRTYFIGVSATGVTTGTTVHVPCKDTSGNLINCNYFKVDCITNLTTGSGVFVAEPSGSSIFRSVGSNPVAYNVASLPTSGICGVGSVFGGSDGGSAEWHGSNGEVCKAVNIRTMCSNGSVFFGVTYGNLLPYNMLRSDSYTKGV